MYFFDKSLHTLIVVLLVGLGALVPALHRMLRTALNHHPAEIENALREVIFPELEELVDQSPDR